MGLKFIVYDEVLILFRTPVLLGAKCKSNVSWLGKVFERVERLSWASPMKPIGFFPMHQAQHIDQQTQWCFDAHNDAQIIFSTNCANYF